MTKLNKVGIVAMLLACFCMVGCSEAQIITDLNLALQAAEVLIPLITPFLGSGASPTMLKVAAWTKDGLAAVSAASACESQDSTAAEKAACVTAALAGVVASEPDLAGLPANIAAAVQNFANYLGTILNTYGSKAAVPWSNKIDTGNMKFSLSVGAKTKLDAIATRALTDKAQLNLAEEKR
jgi:hypothetical protein